MLPRNQRKRGHPETSLFKTLLSLGRGLLRGPRLWGREVKVKDRDTMMWRARLEVMVRVVRYWETDGGKSNIKEAIVEHSLTRNVFDRYLIQGYQQPGKVREIRKNSRSVKCQGILQNGQGNFKYPEKRGISWFWLWCVYLSMLSDRNTDFFLTRSIPLKIYYLLKNVCSKTFRTIYFWLVQLGMYIFMFYKTGCVIYQLHEEKKAFSEKYNLVREKSISEESGNFCLPHCWQLCHGR